MSENNSYFEVIQNRLDTLVDKIIQKEQTDEDFRITYAQILEKINTKMDLFSNSDTTEEIRTLGQEIGQLLQSRQEILDAKFLAIKSEFEHLNKLLFESLKTPELLAAFNKIHNQIHYLTETQESQKESYNALVVHLENFGTLQDTNEIIVNDFAIINEQNTTIKNQIDELLQFNKEIEANNKRLLEELASIVFKIKDLSEQTADHTDDVKIFIADKIDSIITKLQESDATIEILNNNLNTLVEVVGNIFDDESFEELKTDVSDIFKKSELISATLKELTTREEFVQNSENNKNEIKQNTLDLITQLETNIFTRLNVADITDIKNYAEKIFFQGTEVLKEEIWGIKDTVKNIDETAVKQEIFEKNIQTTKDDIVDIISEESVATTQQIKEVNDSIEILKNEITAKFTAKTADDAENIKKLSANIEASESNLTDKAAQEHNLTRDKISALANDINVFKDDITDIISVESVAASDQIKNVVQQIDHLKEDITYIISGESIASAQQIKQLSSSLENLKTELNNLIINEQGQQIKQLSSSLENLKTELNNLIINEQGQQIKQLSSSLENLKTELNNLIINEQGQQIEIALQNLQTKFVTQLVQVAGNISFEEQADDINDNITSVSNEIKDEISGITSGITEHLSNLKIDITKLQKDTENGSEEIVTSIDKINETLKAGVSEEINNLASKIKLLTNGFREDNDFSYTLPDVESDIAKIRADLSNIQRTLINPDSLTEDHSLDIATRLNDLKAVVQKMQDSPITHQVAEIKELFGGLGEDISSISKRTNKLIISSDEVTKKLLSNISAFTALINTFDKQSKAFYNSTLLKDINKKVETITKGTEAIVQSNNAMNEAFVYMGEWIDTASDSFDNLQNDISKIKKTLLSDAQNLTEKIEMQLSEINNKIDIEVNNINQKLNEQQSCINKIIEQQADSQELKSLLEFVASQVSITNEKMIENEQLTQKILNMEKQLKKIEKNIAIITEYIDEDDNYDE